MTTEEMNAEDAAKVLFKLLSGGSPTSDEFAREFDEKSYEDFWSSHSETTIFVYLADLCQHFGIDMAKMSAFIAAITDCDYCGGRTSKVEKMPDGEHVCADCLARFEKEKQQ